MHLSPKTTQYAECQLFTYLASKLNTGYRKKNLCLTFFLLILQLLKK